MIIFGNNFNIKHIFEVFLYKDLYEFCDKKYQFINFLMILKQRFIKSKITII